MTEREGFGLVVRTAGFVALLASAMDVLHLLFVQLGIPVATHYPPQATIAAAIAYFLAGMAMLVSASSIVGLVYGRPRL